MKTVFEALRTGNAKERLAVAADITSIAGVSFASIIGGLFAIGGTTGKLYVGNLVFVVLSSLATLAVACGAIAIFIILLTKAAGPWKAPPGVQPLVITAMWLIFLCLVLSSSFVYYEFISSFRIFI